MQADFDAGTIGVRYLFDDEQRRENTYVPTCVFIFEVPTAANDSFIHRQWNSDVGVTTELQHHPHPQRGEHPLLAPTPARRVGHHGVPYFPRITLPLSPVLSA